MFLSVLTNKGLNSTFLEIEIKSLRSDGVIRKTIDAFLDLLCLLRVIEFEKWK